MAAQDRVRGESGARWPSSGAACRIFVCASIAHELLNIWPLLLDEGHCVSAPVVSAGGELFRPAVDDAAPPKVKVAVAVSVDVPPAGAVRCGPPVPFALPEPELHRRNDLCWGTVYDVHGGSPFLGIVGRPVAGLPNTENSTVDY